MKKLLSTVLAIAMITALFATTAVGTEAKAPSEWAKESVEKAKELSITERDYDYTAPISREDFCEIIYNYINTSGNGLATDSAEPFSDTDSEKVASLYTLGIINGKSETKFAPNDTLTREEAATILSRVVDKMWGEIAVTMQLIGFADADKISDWSRNGIQLIYKLGIMQGVGMSGEMPIFSPKTTLTAEQAITTVVRLYEKQPVKTFADKLNSLMPENVNYMFSPFSIKMALMMAANGADGETQQEILDAVGVSDIEEYNANTKQMIENFNSIEVLKLNVANSIWLNSDQTKNSFSETFSNKMQDVFGATSEIVNDATAVSKINDWVNEKTNGKIPTIIDNSEFVAMLVNAVYFKAKWHDEFRITEKDTFTERNGKEKSIDFMRRTDYMDYAEHNGVKMVRIPYRRFDTVYDDNGKFLETKLMKDAVINMYVMMSDNAFDAEKTIVGSAFKNTYVELSMPKFKIEYQLSLSKLLKEIGIVKAFVPGVAELQDMVPGEALLHIKDVLHKTYIDVNEKETEAAAVTAVGVGGSGSVRPEPIEIKFNKPFTFVIRDDVSGEILFMGEYAFAK